MQGEFDDGAQADKSLLDTVMDATKERAPFAELIDLEFSGFPENMSVGVERLKKNVLRFLFYYMCIFLFVDILFIFIHRLLILPICFIIAAFLAVIASQAARANNKDVMEITPTMALGGFLGTSLIACIIFRKLPHLLVYFFAFNAFIGIIVAAHCLFVRPKEEEGATEI